MAKEVSQKKEGDTSAGRYPLESGRTSLESARLGILNNVNLDERACPSLRGDNIQ